MPPSTADDASVSGLGGPLRPPPFTWLCSSSGTCSSVDCCVANSARLSNRVYLASDKGDGIDISPDGKHVVTGSKDKTARVWRLLRAGADIKLRDVNGSTALRLATDQGHTECVAAFREHLQAMAAATKQRTTI